MIYGMITEEELASETRGGDPRGKKEWLLSYAGKTQKVVSFRVL